MRRIIYAWNYLQWGGAQIYTIALIKEARKTFDIVVVLPEGSDIALLELLQNEGIRYEMFPMAHILPSSLHRIPKVGAHARKINDEYAMLQAIKKIGVDGSIVHVDLLPASSLFSLVWLALRVPVFVTVHNTMSRVSWWRWRLWKLKFRTLSYFENVNVFSANEHAARSFRRLFGSRVSADMKVTYASIHPPQVELARQAPFDLVSERRLHSIGIDRFVFLTVGQFIDRKGRWILLEAARIVKMRSPNVEFVWIAPNLPTPTEQAKIDSYGLGDSFRLIRSSDIGVDRHSILRFFRVADAFVLPSIIEGLPIALLEAMAMGLPSISTDIFGIPEAVVDGKTGLLVEAGNSDALAEALGRIYNDEELRERLSFAGREYVMTRFDDRTAASIATEAYLAAETANVS